MPDLAAAAGEQLRIADGLNQFAPRMDLGGWTLATRPLLERPVFVVPAFRAASDVGIGHAK